MAVVNAVGLEFLVAREDLRRARVTQAPLADPEDLREGELLLEIEKFGFSANNITYATLGVAMRYWEFFPGPDGWGRVPVWGYARVVGSAHSGIEVGERVFGYLPMSTHVSVLADRVNAHGFVDAAPHRTDLPAVYQRYSRVGTSAVEDDREDQDALWRPLFMTSFGAADFLADRGVFGGKRVVCSSASSKTAMGTAFLLGRWLEDVERVALTSRGNVAFTERSGYYERVLDYEDSGELADEVPAVFADFAGNDQLAGDLRLRLGESLRRTIVIGATHWDQREVGAPLTRPDSDLFFLPPWMEKRRAEWGPGGFARRYDEAWTAFLPTAERWMQVEHHYGPTAVEAVYRRTLEGNADPTVGYILSLLD